MRQKRLISKKTAQYLRKSKFIIFGAGILPELVLRHFLPDQIIIIDRNEVALNDLSTLNFMQKDIGIQKAEACKKRLQSIYPIEIKTYPDLKSANTLKNRSKPSRNIVLIGLDYDCPLTFSNFHKNDLIIFPEIQSNKILFHYGYGGMFGELTKKYSKINSKLAYPEHLFIGSLCLLLIIKLFSRDLKVITQQSITFEFPKIPDSSPCGNIAIIGAGGVGSFLSEMITRSFPHLKLTIFEGDVIQAHNLSRQNYIMQDIGKFKAESLAKRLSEINGHPRQILNQWFKETSNKNSIKDSHVVFDAVDKHISKHQINRYCVRQRIPLVFSGATGYQGWVLPVLPPISPCLQEVIPFIKEPPGCQVQGVMLSEVIFIAYYQLIEGLKLLNREIPKELLFADFLNLIPTPERINIVKNDFCPLCNTVKDNKKAI